jgi:hypothetical protein
MSLVFLISFASSNSLQAQNEDNPNGNGVLFIQGGFTTFSLPLLKQYIDQTAGIMSAAYNINAQKLLQFPGNWFVGGSLNICTSEQVEITLGGYYTQTKGHIGYRDINGNYNEVMRLHIVFLKAGLQLDLLNSNGIIVYGSVQGGVLLSFLDIQDQVEIYQLSKYNSTSNTKLKAYFWASEFSLGMNTQFCGLIVSMECGYRLNIENQTYDFKDSFNGWTLSSRLGIPLQW